MTWYNSAYIFWQDANGKIATTQWATQDQDDSVPAEITALATAGSVLSCCGIKAVQFATTHIMDQTPISGAYGTVWDRAVLLDKFEGQKGSGQISIPGPLESIFLSDNVTVDLNNTNVQDFIAEVLANMGNASGTPVSSVYKGRRSKVRSTFSI